MKLKNSNCDETLKTQFVMTVKKLKWQLNSKKSKTHFSIEFKHSIGD